MAKLRGEIMAKRAVVLAERCGPTGHNFCVAIMKSGAVKIYCAKCGEVRTV